jgi:hypothetical protein
MTLPIEPPRGQDVVGAVMGHLNLPKRAEGLGRALSVGTSFDRLRATERHQTHPPVRA